MCKDSTLECIPDYYDALSIPFWHKIYTTNIDDAIDRIYQRSSKRVQNLIYPRDDFQERNQLLESMQVVYLHGKLPCDPKDVIFAKQQYALATIEDQPLYRQFVSDYASMCTIFLGTELDEPLFEQYIQARRSRDSHKEQRPRSFIICPQMSRVRIENLSKIYNVHYIQGTTFDFMGWIQRIARELPLKEDILRITFPDYHLIKTRENSQSMVAEEQVAEFSKCFSLVPTTQPASDNRKSQYLMGAEPAWNDIFKELDIPRTISQDILKYCQSLFGKNAYGDKQRIVSIGGSAGSGKTTIIKRLGITLSRQGIPVFYSKSNGMPLIGDIHDMLRGLKQRSVLIFDNANNMLSFIPQMAAEFSKLDNPPLLILSLRANHLDRLTPCIDREIMDYKEFLIPDLDDDEINLLIDKLDHHHLLGVLKGCNYKERFHAFKVKAKKQILIAMKEATKGKKFEEIINDEYNEITPNEARFICLCVALCTEAGFSLTRQEILNIAASMNPSAVLNYLEKNLRGIIIPDDSQEHHILRHRMLADHIISHCATPEKLKDAYIKVLSGLSPQLLHSKKKFNLYKTLTNHKNIFERFKNNMDLAREVYDNITPFFHENAHFWLQYASLEIEGMNGNLDLAENYINQAYSLSPDSSLIRTTQCLMYYKKSSQTANPNDAYLYKQSADELAEELIRTTGESNPHIFHVKIKGDLEYANKWIPGRSEQKKEIERLLKFCETAKQRHPRILKLRDVETEVRRTLYSFGIPQ